MTAPVARQPLSSCTFCRTMMTLPPPQIQAPAPAPAQPPTPVTVLAPAPPPAVVAPTTNVVYVQPPRPVVTVTPGVYVTEVPRCMLLSAPKSWRTSITVSLTGMGKLASVGPGCGARRRDHFVGADGRQPHGQLPLLPGVREREQHWHAQQLHLRPLHERVPRVTCL